MGKKRGRRQRRSKEQVVLSWVPMLLIVTLVVLLGILVLRNEYNIDVIDEVSNYFRSLK